MTGPVVNGAGGAAAPAPFEIVVTSPGEFAARGALTFANARSARIEGLHALHTSTARELQVDCGGITRSDSAGLAVLLDWLAEARRAGKALHFERLPDGLLRLARISAVDGMLQQGV